MVNIEQCRVSLNGFIILEASIDNALEYEDCYIKSVFVDDDKTFVSTTSPSDSAIPFSVNTNTKKISMKISLEYLDSSLNDGIFFVYILAGSSEEEEYALGVAANYKLIYNKILNHLNECNNKCVIPSNFIDTILLFKAFEVSLKTGNINSAIKYWKNIILKPEEGTLSRCTCYGNHCASV